jgi:hypothetical protein
MVCVAPSEKRRRQVSKDMFAMPTDKHGCCTCAIAHNLWNVWMTFKSAQKCDAVLVPDTSFGGRRFLAPNFQLLTRIIWDVCFARWRGLCRWRYIGLGMAPEASNRQTQIFNNLPCSFRTISGVIKGSGKGYGRPWSVFNVGTIFSHHGRHPDGS